MIHSAQKKTLVFRLLSTLRSYDPKSLWLKSACKSWESNGDVGEDFDLSLLQCSLWPVPPSNFYVVSPSTQSSKLEGNHPKLFSFISPSGYQVLYLLSLLSLPVVIVFQGKDALQSFPQSAAIVS